MAAYPPPLANLSVFNEREFSSGFDNISQAEADLRYLKLSGGTEIGPVIFDGGLTSTEPVYCTSDTKTPSLNVTGITNMEKSLTVDGNIFLTNDTSRVETQGANSYVYVSNTEAAVDSSSGAFRSPGGAYIGNNSVIGGTLTMPLLGHLEYQQGTAQSITAGTGTTVNYSTAISDTFGANITIATSGAGKSFTNSSGKTQTWLICFTHRYTTISSTIDSWISLTGTTVRYGHMSTTVSATPSSHTGSVVLFVPNASGITIRTQSSTAGTISNNATTEASAITIHQLIDSN